MKHISILLSIIVGVLFGVVIFCLIPLPSSIHEDEVNEDKPYQNLLHEYIATVHPEFFSSSWNEKDTLCITMSFTPLKEHKYVETAPTSNFVGIDLHTDINRIYYPYSMNNDGLYEGLLGYCIDGNIFVEFIVSNTLDKRYYHVVDKFLQGIQMSDLSPRFIAFEQSLTLSDADPDGNFGYGRHIVYDLDSVGHFNRIGYLDVR